jgi:hypothetical protein
LRSTWEFYKGKRIFSIRYDHLNFDQLKAEMHAAEKETLTQPAGSVLMLIDTTGTIITPDALLLFKNVASSTRKYTQRAAVLGVNGTRRALLDIVVKFSGMNVVTFDDAAHARDWLASE